MFYLRKSVENLKVLLRKEGLGRFGVHPTLGVSSFAKKSKRFRSLRLDNLKPIKSF